MSFQPVHIKGRKNGGGRARRAGLVLRNVSGAGRLASVRVVAVETVLMCGRMTAARPLAGGGMRGGDLRWNAGLAVDLDFSSRRRGLRSALRELSQHGCRAEDAGQPVAQPGPPHHGGANLDAAHDRINAVSASDQRRRPQVIGLRLSLNWAALQPAPFILRCDRRLTHPDPSPPARVSR